MKSTAAAPIGGGLWACAMGAVLGLLASWLATSVLYPRVRLDNGWATSATLTIDGGRTITVGGGDHHDESLRYGRHLVEIRHADGGSEQVDVDLPAGTPYLLAMDGVSCFRLSKSSERRVHRWSRLAASRTSTWTLRGRWLSIQDADAITRTPCAPTDGAF